MNSNKLQTVCIFSNLYPPVFSGSSTQCVQLAQELIRQGWKVIVVTSKIDPLSPGFAIENGIYVYRIPAFRFPRMPIALNFPWINFTFTPSNAQRIKAILREHNPDVLHLHNHMFDMALHAVNMARRLKRPLVITIHTIFKHSNMIYDLIFRMIDKFFLKTIVTGHADILICPDQIIKKYATTVLGANETVLIPHGISFPSKPDPKKTLALREEHELGEGPIILSIGHLHEIRNRRELIEIMPRLLRRFPTLKIIIVGDIATQTAEILATRLNVRDHLIFTGAVPHPEIPQYLALADLEATWFDSSHPHRSLGIAAREAMAAGIVVIAAVDQDVFGKGILQDGKNVILVDLNDPEEIVRRIIEILRNKEKRQVIGELARQTVREHFSWKKVGRQTIHVYRTLIS